MQNRRWYDKYDETQRALTLLKSLDRELQRKFSKDIIDVAITVKNMNSESEEPPLSIGVERVLGMYQASQARRWYDKKSLLATAIKEISSLPEPDYKHVMEGICLSADN